MLMGHMKTEEGIYKLYAILGCLITRGQDVYWPYIAGISSDLRMWRQLVLMATTRNETLQCMIGRLRVTNHELPSLTVTLKRIG